MKISDLVYLEEVSEATALVGGSGYFDQNTSQWNNAYVNQYANGYSDAEAFRGNAYASTGVSNYSGIYQNNVNYS